MTRKPVIDVAQVNDTKRYFVSCQAMRIGEGWFESRTYYLHTDGFWHLSTASESGWSGYFDTRAAAEGALRMNAESARPEIIPLMTNIDAQAKQARAEKREFQN